MAGEIQKWADRAMYLAPPIDAQSGPKVTILSANSDPLGEIACATMTYEGKFPPSLADVTDEQRRFYLEDVFKAHRWAPLEFVNFHFLIEGVTRGFTHQMVRQRTAVYAQESVRFAVKEDVPVALPASLADTVPWKEWLQKHWAYLYPVESVTGNASVDELRLKQVTEFAEQQASKQQLQRRRWDSLQERIAEDYNWFIEDGMPAEDARGTLPTNLLTRIHYHTNLRNLYEHAGQRLCTQAQHEWKGVWKAIIQAIKDYGESQTYYNGVDLTGWPASDAQEQLASSSDWQFEELSKVFKPICYQTGKCEYMSSADRYCSIRDRVNGFASLGIPSVRWDSLWVQDNDGQTVSKGIQSEEWMDNHESARISQ